MTCFRYFFSDFVLKHIKEETNKYAAQLKRSPQHRDTVTVKEWTTVSLQEIKGFILILIHMGVLKKPSIRDYWSTEEFIRTDFAGSIMPRDRFLVILSMLHFCDNTHYIPVGEPGHDPLYKIKTLYEQKQLLKYGFISLT